MTAPEDAPRKPRPGGAGRRRRPRGEGGRGRPGGYRRPPRAALIALDSGEAAAWAAKIEKYLAEKHGTVFRMEVSQQGGLSGVVKEVRTRGAHRVIAVGDTDFVRWSAQAMVGSLMPLAPVLLPGSKAIFGHRPVDPSRWQAQVDTLLTGRFAKVDMAMGTVEPFVHQLVAGFPVRDGGSGVRIWEAFKAADPLHLSIEVDRSTVEGEFWCLVIANADLTDGALRWVPGANWTDQCLDLMLVRPRPLLQRLQFVRALRQGLHGAQSGVIRYRCRRVTVRAQKPWRYAADGGRSHDAADPLILEARPEKLRLVESPGS